MWLIRSNTASNITITSGTVVFDKVDFGGITGAGTANWDLSAQVGSYFGNFGGNIGITNFTPAVDQHWINVGADNKWGTASNWTSRVPLPQDNVYMNYAFGLNQTITCESAPMVIGHNIDWTGATWTGTLTWVISANSDMSGDLTLKSGMTISSASGTLRFTSGSNCTITSNGVTFARNITVRLMNASLLINGDLTFGTTVGTSSAVNWGTTIDSNGYNLNLGILTINSSSITVKSSGAGTINIIGTGSCINGTSGSTHIGTIKFTDTSNSAITFGCNNMTWDKIWFARGASTATITWNANASGTFQTILDTGTVAHTHAFNAFSAYNITNFLINGNSTANRIVLASSAGGNKFFLSKLNGGIASVNYVDIKDCTSSPLSTWYAGTTSLNTSNNLGWNFIAPQHFFAVM